MPFEAFLQLIKKIINMGSFQSPAYQICHFWSMRSALLLSLNSYLDVQDDDIQYSSQLQFLTQERLDLSPVLVSMLEKEEVRRVYATRHVRSFERGALEVRGNDWVLVSANGRSRVGRVGEIIELVGSGGSCLRLHLRDARPVESFDPTRGSILSVACSVLTTEEIVNVESESFHELHCDEQDEGVLRFTYIY